MINSFKCFFCGKEFDSIIGHEIHHYIPKCIGGLDCEDNRVSTCYSCHRILHSKPDIMTCYIHKCFYRILCKVIGIIPVKDGYDDDVNYFMNHSNENIDKNMLQLSLGMSLVNQLFFGYKPIISDELFEKVQN